MSLGKEIELLPASSYEGYTPEVWHENGMLTLLKQLFRDNSINCELLAGFAIEKKLGTVITEQCLSEIDSDEDGDDEVDNGDVVFGFTAAYDIQKYKREPAIKNLKEYLLKKIEQYGTKSELELATSYIIGDETKGCTFVVNERVVNMPANITLVSLNEIVEAYKNSGRNSEGNVVLIICKMFQRKNHQEKSHFHDEEQIFQKYATMYLDYPVDPDEFGTIFLPAQHRDAEDEDCPQYRRIYFIQTSDFCNGVYKDISHAVSEVGTASLSVEHFSGSDKP